MGFNFKSQVLHIYVFLLTFVTITVPYKDWKVNIYVKQKVDLNMQCIRK